MSVPLLEFELEELARIGECLPRGDDDVAAARQHVMTPPGQLLTFYLRLPMLITLARNWQCEGLDSDSEVGQGHTPMAAYLNYHQRNARVAKRMLKIANAELTRLAPSGRAAALKGSIDLDWAVELAAGCLPAGWEVQVSIQHGCAMVELYNLRGARVHDAQYDAETPLADAVIECIEVAQGDRPANVPPDAYR